MNKTNTVFEALNGLDEKYISEAVGAIKEPRERTTKKPIKLALTAVAAAAALTLLVGFAVVYKSNVELNGEPVFEYNIRIHDEAVYPSVEELAEMGASDIWCFKSDFHTPDMLDVDITEADPTRKYNIDYNIKNIDPRDLVRKYNIPLLADENFSRADLKGYSTDDYNAEEYRDLILSITGVVAAKDLHADDEYGSYIQFNYWLADDHLDIPVRFRAVCMTGDYNASLTHNFTSIKPDGSDFSVIDLNNNEKALIHQSDNDGGSSMTSYATFTYDGILYDIFAHTDMTGMEQILKDLGVL